MEKELVVMKSDYPQISDWENEGGPAIDRVYRIIDQDKPQLPADLETRRDAPWPEDLRQRESKHRNEISS